MDSYPFFHFTPGTLLVTLIYLAKYAAQAPSTVTGGCREQPPRGTPWVSGLVGHFVQTWPDSKCSHTVQCLDCSDLN